VWLVSNYQPLPLTEHGLLWSDNTIQYLGLTIPIKLSCDKYHLFYLNFDGYCDKTCLYFEFMEITRAHFIGKNYNY